MPLRRYRPPQQYPPEKHAVDPLTSCLDANGTYICTAYNPRCYIIQKVTPNANAVLNPNADIFESKESGTDAAHEWESEGPRADSEATTSEGYVYMNGDVGKLPSGAVHPATPETLTAAASNSTVNEYSSMNGGGAEALENYSQASPPLVLPGSASPGPISGIPMDQLKQLLSSQLEYYFSRENLANDAYLLSQMDNDQYVPIWTVANFNQVKKLTKDIQLITDVLRESPNVQVDEEGVKVRPNHKRCIVILREISDNTPLEDVKALFNGENCPKVISCEFAHNNSWYVTFESDEDAQRAYRFLREEVREFQGKPIMARIKAKPMNRLPLAPVPPMGAGASVVPNVVPGTSAGGAGAAIKNGYRTPPPALYEQNTYANQQTRFLYTNGASVPPSVNYGNQVQIYTFPPQQPFYPPSMLQPWGPANPTYFDIGSVFSVNGLAPQGSFSKPPSARYNNNNMPRRTRKPPPGSTSIGDNGNMQRPGMSQPYHRVGSPGASSIPQAPKSLSAGIKPLNVAGIVNDNHHNHSKSHHSLQASAPDSSDASSQAAGSNLRSDSDDNSYRQPRDAQGKELMPPRHRRRRKEDEMPVPGRPGPSSERKSMAAGDAPQPIHATLAAVRGPQFDLEATAFPPLPGFEAGGNNASVKVTTPLEVTPAEVPASQWGESRLSDVVRGTAKPKTTYSTKDNRDVSGLGHSSPRAPSPASPTPRKMAAPLIVEVKTPPASVLPPASQASPVHAPEASANPTSYVELTPPASPDKIVPLARNSAPKATKTEESVVVSSADDISRKSPEVIASVGVGKPTVTVKPVPTTTNAATMTSAVVVTDVTSTLSRAVATTSTTVVESASQVDGGQARLSYAQVAQHHKEKAERLLREKQSTETNQEKEKDVKKEPTSSRVTHQHGDREAVHRSGDRDHRDGQSRFSGRGGGRSFEGRPDGQGGFRRRDGPPTPRFREFIRPRSPK